jgi:four helix bundle protein
MEINITLHSKGIFDQPNWFRRNIFTFFINFSKRFSMESGFKQLHVYKLAYKLAMEIYEASKTYPKEEKYSLTDQIRRSSRSVCANISEGYRRKKYPKHFISKIGDSDGECSETLVWIDFSRDCKYISEEKHNYLSSKYEEIGKMLGSMIINHEKFTGK